MAYGRIKVSNIEVAAGDDLDLTAVETKLDGIESGATADQTGAEIKTAYEAEADTNAYDDAAVTKLAGIEESATADQTGAEIKAAYEGEADTNAYDDAAVTKLAGIEESATADQTGAEIKAAYEGEANTNAYDDAAVTKLAGIAAGAEVNTVDSVAGKTGAVSLAKADVGLSNVDNTSDADKPVSSATQTALNAKADDSAMTTALAAKADLVGGKLSTSQIPDLAVTEFLGVAASQSAMLALSGQKGDWCNRSDTGQMFIIIGDDPTDANDWAAVSYPASPVVSVAGKTGAVTLSQDDIGSGAVSATTVLGNSEIKTTRFGTSSALGAASDAAFRVGTSADTKAKIGYDGSATLKSTVDVTSATYTYIGRRSSDNTATFAATDAGYVNIGPVSGNNSNIILDGSNGNATFAGNVGVGTTAPGTKLQVNGDVKVVNTGTTYLQPNTISTFQTYESSGPVKIELLNNGSINAAGDLFKLYPNGSIDLYRQTTTGTNGLLTFHSDLGGTRTQKAIINADGSAEFADMKMSPGNVFQNLKWQPNSSSPDVGFSFYSGAGNWCGQFYAEANTPSYGFLNSNWGSWDLRKIPNGSLTIRYGSSTATVWHSLNDGSGSGLDADNLDGYTWTSSGKDLRGSNIYADNWFRNYLAGYGLYNEATGAHIVSDQSGAWTLRDADSSMRLHFKTNGSTERGSIYANSSNDFGFLNNSGNWSLRCDSSRNVQCYGDLTAVAFRIDQLSTLP